MNLYWEDIWASIGVLAVLTFGVFVTTVSFHAKNVDYYYLSVASGGGHGICVEAHWTWHNDELAYCTDDKDKALDFAAKANAGLKH